MSVADTDAHAGRSHSYSGSYRDGVAIAVAIPHARSVRTTEGRNYSGRVLHSATVAFADPDPDDCAERSADRVAATVGRDSASVAGSIGIGIARADQNHGTGTISITVCDSDAAPAPVTAATKRPASHDAGHFVCSNEP